MKSNKNMEVQQKKYFVETVGEMRNYFGDFPSFVHRGNKGADKGKTRSISARSQYEIRTLGEPPSDMVSLTYLAK